jgi:hypothetical protein
MSNLGTNIHAKQIIKEYAKENKIKYETAEKRLGLQISVDNEITTRRQRLFNDAVQSLENEGTVLSDNNKNEIQGFINQFNDRQSVKLDAEDITNMYNLYKASQTDGFTNNAIEQFSDLQGEDRTRYNNLIQDVSKFIYETGVNVRFDSNLDTLADYTDGVLLLNPSYTNMPVKTILLKELGNELLSNNTKKYIISQMKESGLYDALKEELLASGEFDEANVDNEIVARRLNDLLTDSKELKKMSEKNKNDVEYLKGLVNNLASRLENRNTKDATYLKEASNSLNNVETTTKIEKENKEVVEEKTKNQIRNVPESSNKVVQGTDLYNKINEGKQIVRTTNDLYKLLSDGYTPEQGMSTQFQDKGKKYANYGQQYIKFKPEVLNYVEKMFRGDGATNRAGIRAESTDRFNTIEESMNDTTKMYNEMLIKPNVPISDLIEEVRIPSNSSDELINKLKELGIKYTLYEAGPSYNKTKEVKQETKTEPKKEIGEERKERKAYTSVIQSKNQTEEAKKVSKELLGLDTYIPDSNDKELKRADEHIEKYGVADSLDMLRKNTEEERNNVDDIAVGNRLIQYYSKIGDKENLSEAIQLTAMAGTNVGRAVQAMSLLNRLTPAGQAMWIQRSVDRMNKQMQEAYDKSKRKNKKLQQFNYTDEMKQKIINSDESNLQEHLNEVYAELGQQVQMSFLDALESWRYFSMLSSPTTHIRNIVGNLMMGKMQDVKNVIKGGLEDIYYGVTGKEGERTATYKKTPKRYLEYAKNDIKNVEAQLGIGTNKLTKPKTQLQENMRMFNDSDLGRKLEKVVKKGMIDRTSNLLSAEDVGRVKVFGKDFHIGGLESAYTKALGQYLYANKINLKEISDSQLAMARRFAIEEAKRATFHQESGIATALNTIENQNLFTKVAVGGIIPFKKTPINVAKTALEYNPAGLLKALIVDSYHLYDGKITVNEYIDNISKGLTGTALSLIGFMLSQQGILRTTSGDDDDYDQDRGVQPYSITIGDKTFSLDWLSPSAVPLFVGAELQHQFDMSNRENDSSGAFFRLLDAGVSSLNPVSEMTMLSGVQSALRVYNQDYAKAIEQVGANTIKNYASQIVPSALGKIAKTFDDSERATTSTKKGTVEKAIDTFLRSTASKIPIARNFLPKKTDVWGNEVKQIENPLIRGAYNLLSPSTVKTIRETDLDKEISRLYDKTGESSVLPKTYITKEFTYNDKDYRLTDREYQEYKQALGKDNYEKLNRLINSSEYKKLNDVEKAKVMSQIYSYDRDAMKVGYAKTHNISYNDTTKQTEKKIESLGGNVVDYYLYKTQIPEGTDTQEKRRILMNTGLSNESKSAIYEASVSKSSLDLYKLLKESNVDINAYLDYLSTEFKADKKADGSTINGTKKAKEFNYMNSTNKLNLEQKILILGQNYTLSPSEKNYIAERINASNLSREEKLELYKSMNGFTVDTYGNVRW